MWTVKKSNRTCNCFQDQRKSIWRQIWDHRASLGSVWGHPSQTPPLPSLTLSFPVSLHPLSPSLRSLLLPPSSSVFCRCFSRQIKVAPAAERNETTASARGLTRRASARSLGLEYRALLLEIFGFESLDWIEEIRSGYDEVWIHHQCCVVKRKRGVSIVRPTLA